MNKYAQGKAKAREKAIEWQSRLLNYNYSWGDLYYWGAYFEKLAKRYGLVKEFKENGII